MSYLNQIDLNVRLQLAGCKYSELANSYATNLKYRMKCAPDNLRRLLLLNHLIEVLECYKIGSATSEGTVTLNVLNAGDVLDILVDNISLIGGPRSITSSNISAISSAIATYITANTSYIANYDKRTISIIGDCTNGVLSYYLKGAEGSSVTVTGLDGGVCSNNCLKEEDVQSLLDKISKLICLCFEPIGFEYDIPDGYTLNDDGSLIPE